MLKVEVVTTDSDFGELQEEWKQLVDQVPKLAYFLTWEFASVRWKHFHDERTLYVLTARNEEGSLVGLAPWAIGAGSVGSLSVRRLEFLCRLEIPFRFEQYFLDGEALDIIAHPEYQDQVADVFLDHLDRFQDQWDVVDFAWLAADSPLREHLASSSRLVIERKEQCVWTELPDEWNTFERQVLGKKRAKQLRYQDRLLERHYPGRVKYRSIQCEEEVGSTVEFLDKMKLRQFAAKGSETPAEDNPVVVRHRAFKREFAEAAFARGWWRFYELRVGEEMIAGTCGLVLHGTYFGLQTAYEPNWKRYGPGNLVQTFEVQQLIEEGVSGFDPGHGMNDSKRMWTDLEREDVRVIANSGIRGMPYFARETAAISVRERGRLLARRLLPRSTFTWIKETVRNNTRRLE